MNNMETYLKIAKEHVPADSQLKSTHEFGRTEQQLKFCTWGYVFNFIIPTGANTTVRVWYDETIDVINDLTEQECRQIAEEHKLPSTLIVDLESHFGHWEAGKFIIEGYNYEYYAHNPEMPSEDVVIGLCHVWANDGHYKIEET